MNGQAKKFMKTIFVYLLFTVSVFAQRGGNDPTLAPDPDKDGASNWLEYWTGGNERSGVQSEAQGGSCVLVDIGTAKYYVHLQRLRQLDTWPTVPFFRPVNPLGTPGISGMKFPFPQLEWSEDLQTWEQNVFEPTSLVTAVDHSDGTFTYAAVSTYPIWVSEGHADLTWTAFRDVEMIHINGTDLALGSYPYDLTTDSVDFVADMLSAGYAASVDLSGDYPVITVEEVTFSAGDPLYAYMVLVGNDYFDNPFTGPYSVDNFQRPPHYVIFTLADVPVKQNQFSRLSLTR